MDTKLSDAQKEVLSYFELPNTVIAHYQGLTKNSITIKSDGYFWRYVNHQTFKKLISLGLIEITHSDKASRYTEYKLVNP